MQGVRVDDQIFIGSMQALADGQRWVGALVGDMPMATRIAKAAKLCNLNVHNFDRVQPLLQHAEIKKPEVVFFDWDLCEAKAFDLLIEIKKQQGWEKVSLIGYVSQRKAPLKQEAQRAGCDRVLSKTEFIATLELLVARSIV